jgi:hypothetical protein
VNVGDQLGLGKTQNIIAAFKILRMVNEWLAPKRRLVKVVRLDHRSHRAIENQNALSQDLS